MTNENTELQKDLDEINADYENAMAEIQSDMSVIPGMNDTQMHVINLVLAVIMIVIGAIFAYQTRNANLKRGKKIAGWILLILGILTLITHVIQLIF